MEDFYCQLSGFTDISQLVDDSVYCSVPDDWYVSVVDVRGSTEAIEQGNYRDVNFIGAAAITAHLNLVDHDLPFIFGGDGAVVLINKSLREATLKVLQSLSYYAKEIFNLELHTGMVSVKELRSRGKELQVAKYVSGIGIAQAMFKGGGISLAETLLKSDSMYRCEPAARFESTEIFAGLTCRWKPIPSGKGVTLSILIQPVEDDNRVLPEVITQLKRILGSFENANPVRMENARYYSVLENLKRQIKISDGGFNRAFIKEIFAIFMAVPFFNLGLFKLIPSVKQYIEHTPLHCDFKKFDDTLRMVLNCSINQYQAIEQYLHSASLADQVSYGIQVSDAAQMTCYVESMTDGGHLHFVDGTDGGYALAAKKLKNALSARLAKVTD
ncbi:DUF3095 family protein [Amphritea sp. 1_MG-2023]|uniref:DUF3095 family protein n=1 Tax=Amphritea sp. 1_MG-2023 TaxID=3062670 RepID=UPI0026E21585|nr:DUF3095 family protein [Amphritea sp. 1_MG-2023]MDO6562363.1 DUF3095 family protein [Amphritea sp. 1_MG-2023]